MSIASSHAEKINFIWSIKEVLRDHYKRHQYGEVILPFCMVRRLDCVLDKNKSKVLQKAKSIKGSVDKHFDLLSRESELPFYNTSKFTFDALLDDPEHVAENLFDYVQGFSPNVRFALDKFGIQTHISRLNDAGILYMVMQKFSEIDFHPNSVSNVEMGYIYEELIRVTSDLSNEEAGEHFTPREVIHLMVNMLFAEEDQLLTKGKIVTIYDPSCGTGGMLTVAEEHIQEKNPKARPHLFGQEIQPESYAICEADMLMRTEFKESTQSAAKIVFGDSFKEDGFSNNTFDYMLANPPYGKDWKSIEKFIKDEHAIKGMAGRFGVGLPPTSDGQLLFLQHMISKMKPESKGGSRIGIVMNGSPLFSGDAGSGTSEIRRWIIENDWLEAIVGLPDQLFYNTGIFTYIWVVTNRKREERKGYVQLIDARKLSSKMKKSLGNKRNELSQDHISEITRIYESFVEGELSKILPNEFFGYKKITVERPLRLRIEITKESLKEIEESKDFNKLTPEIKEQLRKYLKNLDVSVITSIDKLNDEFEIIQKVGVKLSVALKKTIEKAFQVKDPNAEPLEGQPDPDLRDTENVPLNEDIETYMIREVLPFVSDAWVDDSKTKIGYEIPFTRQFYKYIPPRPLSEIDADIRASEERILKLLGEVTKI